MKTYDSTINYVGSSIFRGDRFIGTKGDIDINWCAYQHDRYYEDGRFSRREADDRFFACMMMKIRRSDATPDIQGRAQWKAMCYYKLVLRFGWLFYNSPKKIWRRRKFNKFRTVGHDLGRL